METIVPDSAKTQSPKSYVLTNIAKTHLGEVAAAIVSCLISYGRLTAKELSKRSKLPLKLVKTSLVSLIQMNCIYYWKEDNSRVVHYSFNEEGLFVLLHSGDIIHYITLKYGEKSAEIVQNVIENGHMKIEDYISNIEDEEENFETQNLFFKLFTESWLKRVQQINFNPIDDLWNRVYQDTLKNTPRSSTTSEIKRVAEAKERAKLKFTDLMEGGNNPKELYIVTSGIKKLNPEIVVAFNLERFEKHLRSIALVNLAKSRVGSLSAKVYETALSLIEQNSPDLRPTFLKISGLINDPEEERIFINSIENKLVDDKKIVFNVRDLIKYLPEGLDLRNSILTHNFLKPNIKKRINEDVSEIGSKKLKLENDEEMVAVDTSFDSNSTDNSDPHSLSLVNHHLKLLCSSQCIFLTEITPGVYTVPYKALAEQLKKYNYESLIKATLGQDAFKILRCLKGLKLADEKAISNTILLKEKAVRNELFRLIKMNIIEIQEVPRSVDRAASKTFYLFRHKSATSYNFFRNCLLFCMAEILTSIQELKEDHKILLEKCERDDVKGKEEELLLDSELKTLKTLQLKEIDYIGKFNRIKSLYNIFNL